MANKDGKITGDRRDLLPPPTLWASTLGKRGQRLRNSLKKLLAKFFLFIKPIILAGYDADINRLMSINPGLTSCFPEAVIFNHLSPEECLNLLTQLLRKKKSLNTSVLDPPSEILRNQLLEHFTHLSKLPSWGNAHNIQSIVKSIFGSIISTSTLPIGPLVVTK